jgi:copper chaperone CopZ
MRARFTVILTLMVTLVLTTVASSETMPEYISSVEIYVDGFICATCVRALESALELEEGVSDVTTDLETGIVAVIPEMDGDRPVSLIDLEKRVNGMSEYTVRKMNVVAQGRVVKFSAKYHEMKVHVHSHDRYRLQVGKMHFILSENKKLDELIKSGYEIVRAEGTVSAFSERVPVMVLGDFQKAEEEPKPVTGTDPLDAIGASLAKEKEVMKEKEEHAHIDSVRVYVDGLICAACEGPLKTDLLKEEGVEIVGTDVDLGLIEIIPKEGKMFELRDLEQRINAMKEYKVIKIDVVTSGEVIELNIDYHAGTAHPHPHKRYKLMAGESTGFILSENEKLKEILKSGDKNVTVVGTVAAFRGNTPILEIKEFKKLEKQPEWLKPKS